MFPQPLDSEYTSIAWGVSGPQEKFKPVLIPRPKNLSPKDVKFEMLYCGICHSDVFFAES